MPIVHFINNKSQTAGGLRNVLAYVSKAEKTELEDKRFVTALNCSAETAYEEFNATKNLYHKNNGRLYYHLVQSFPSGYEIAPELAHRIAVKFAMKAFSKYECVVATHIDREHIHSHIVFNSVSFEDGRKYHSDKQSVERLMKLSDEICWKYGVQTLYITDSGYYWLSLNKYDKISVRKIPQKLIEIRCWKGVIMKKQQHYNAGLYCRLSVDDGNFGGSVSIETQKILLEQYCKDHSITNYTFYCDDGCSGPNFNRPSFRKMIEDINSGKINLVIVKDLSRFGRNYVETGMYVQQFTERNVRFIAADDNYDSLTNGDDLLFPIKNVVNEMYARDVSKKTKAAKKAKARAGQFIGSKAPFGYKIDPNDRHHLIIDNPVSEVVRRIFRLDSCKAGTRAS